ncbi:MAG: peptidase M55 [Candidatus Lokiarchaeota archaeon]|nr:peptidase M55 [Candidatus Lokiarchaeota archaeon]
MLRNLFILTDLEGVAGVTKFKQTREKGIENEKAKELLTQELNAVIDGINDLDDNIQIHIWDGHGSGGIIPEKLKPIETYIPHKSKKRFSMQDFFMENHIEALAFVGQHAMAGTPNANLAHTMSSRTIEYYKLNEMEIGEFGLRAALAGELGVPTIFISGDDKACNEAEDLIPNIVSAVVKNGTGLESAESLPFNEVYALLEKKIKISIKNMSKIEPYTINTPVTLEKRYRKENTFSVRFKWFYQLLKIFNKKRAEYVDHRTIRWKADSVRELENLKII